MADLNLTKITDYLYEIPQTGAMRVPGRIYASPQLMESQKSDEAVQQVRNVACLPGIVKYSLAMPDFHWGYGFPIGGVAAFDLETGVISPGGVGYDINCLSGDTPVLTALGYTRPIQELATPEPCESVTYYNTKRKRMGRADVIQTIVRPPGTPVWELVTRSGQTITATEDHPFWTPWGMKPLKKIKENDRVALFSFNGVPYENPSDKVLVSENHMKRTLRDLGYRNRGNAVPQILAHLKKNKMLPMTTRHPALPVLLKVMGYLLGDGALYFEAATGKGKAVLNGTPEDLGEIRKNLAPWVQVSRVYSRRRKHTIHTPYRKYSFESTEHFVRISSTGFTALLAALGLPTGKRASQSWEVPVWLKKAPLWQQRLFLAGFFGAELTSPDVFKKHGRNFKCPVLNIVKRSGFVESGEKFLVQLAKMLRGFGVTALIVSQRREQKNPDRTISYRLRLVLSDTTDNLIRLWSTIGFEYNRKRSLKASHAVAYLRAKKAALAQLDHVRSHILELRATTGWGAKKIMASLRGYGVPVNRRFVERTIYESPHRILRAPESFPTFPEWLSGSTKGLGTSGLIWETVLAKRPRPEIKRVYDITVNHPDHNFVAGGFLVRNCGVRLMRTNLTHEEVKPKFREVVKNLFKAIPAGVGSHGAIPKLSQADAKKLLTDGAHWAVEHGHGKPEDLDHIEDGGRMAGADPGVISDRAVTRGLGQIGTLGSGNHFLELQVIDEVYQPAIADRMGLQLGGIAVAIHSGSRGFGYQVCDDFLKVMGKAVQKYGIALPDRQLACAPLSSPEAKEYLAAMACAANYAWVNRQVMKAITERVLARTMDMSEKELDMRLIYDVCHNIAKMEDHEVDGKRKKVCVHRKGATRAFGPGHPLVPAAYKDIGQPVLVPGDMGRYSFLCIGTNRAMADTFGSTCHGAGRQFSRSAMIKQTKGRNLFKEMENRGVLVMAQGMDSVAEEMPEAYKDVGLVVDVMEKAGISTKVVKLRPIGVVKG